MPAFMRAFLFKSSTKVELSYKVKKSPGNIDRMLFPEIFLFHIKNF